MMALKMLVQIAFSRIELGGREGKSEGEKDGKYLKHCQKVEALKLYRERIVISWATSVPWRAHKGLQTVPTHSLVLAAVLQNGSMNFRFCSAVSCNHRTVTIRQTVAESFTAYRHDTLY